MNVNPFIFFRPQKVGEAYINDIMKTRTKYLLYAALVPAAAIGLVGMHAASAHGLFVSATPDEIAARQETMFSNEAAFLGISVDEVKSAWAQGKTLRDMAQEHGITDEQLRVKAQERFTQKLKDQLQTLVTKGVITQAQADQRLAAMQGKIQNRPKHMGMGFGRLHF